MKCKSPSDLALLHVFWGGIFVKKKIEIIPKELKPLNYFGILSRSLPI